MPLKTRNTIVPGGFRYVQKETGFKPSPMVPFNNVVNEIFEHRKANNLPRATKPEIAEDLEVYTCNRLGNDPAWCISDKKKLFQSSKTSPSPSHLSDLVRPAVEKFKSLGTGAQILADWVGGGMLPVSTELAQSRADSCTGRKSGAPCKFNLKGSRFTESIATAIKEQMQKRHEATAIPEGDERLLECQLCYCDLKLKVHVPIETIIDRTPKAMIEKFQEQAPDVCWLKRETKTIPAK